MGKIKQLKKSISGEGENILKTNYIVEASSNG